jgi:hypothetical protein
MNKELKPRRLRDLKVPEASSVVFQSVRGSNKSLVGEDKLGRRRIYVKDSLGQGWALNKNINNLEQEERRKVEKEIKARERVASKRRKARFLGKTWIGILSLVVILVLLCQVAARSEVRFSNPEALGDSYKNRTNSLVEAKVKGGTFGFIRPSFTRIDQIRDGVLESGSEFRAVNAKFNLFKFRVDLEIENRVPVLEWNDPRLKDGKVWIDDAGYLFSPDPEYLAGFKPVVVGGTGLSLADQGGDNQKVDTASGSSPVIGVERLQWISMAIPKMQAGGIGVASVNIDGAKFKEVEVMIKSDGGNVRFIFSSEEDPARSAESAIKSIAYLRQSRTEGLAGLGYVDVSSPDRVLYK